MVYCDVFLYNANKKKYIFKKSFSEYIDSVRMLREYDSNMALEEVDRNEYGEWFKFSSAEYNRDHLLPEEFATMFIHVHE